MSKETKQTGYAYKIKGKLVKKQFCELDDLFESLLLRKKFIMEDISFVEITSTRIINSTKYIKTKDNTKKTVVTTNSENYRTLTGEEDHMVRNNMVLYFAQRHKDDLLFNKIDKMVDMANSICISLDSKCISLDNPSLDNPSLDILDFTDDYVLSVKYCAIIDKRKIIQLKDEWLNIPASSDYYDCNEEEFNYLFVLIFSDEDMVLLKLSDAIIDYDDFS